MSVVIDGDSFWKRILSIHSAWQVRPLDPRARRPSVLHLDLLCDNIKLLTIPVPRQRNARSLINPRLRASCLDGTLQSAH